MKNDRTEVLMITALVVCTLGQAAATVLLLLSLWRHLPA